MAKARKRERASTSTGKSGRGEDAKAKGLLESVGISVKNPQVIYKPQKVKYENMPSVAVCF